MNFYVSICKNSKVVSVTRYGEAGPGPKGTVMSATFQLDGQEFYALNGGPMFTFSPAISFFVKCETQPEIDEMWEKLSAGGEKQRCGWLKDKYGVSWQIVPPVLGEMLSDKDAEKSKRVMEAIIQMTPCTLPSRAETAARHHGETEYEHSTVDRSRIARGHLFVRRRNEAGHTNRGNDEADADTAARLVPAFHGSHRGA